MTKYRVLYNPATGLPIRTAKFTLDKIETFLGAEYAEDDWKQLVGARWNRERSILLYATREASRKPEQNRAAQLTQLFRKYQTRQPIFWARFLREKYPMAQITDFFSMPFDDTDVEYLHYEGFMSEAGEHPDETGRVFDPMPYFVKLKAEFAQLAEKMDMNKAIEEPA